MSIQINTLTNEILGGEILQPNCRWATEAETQLNLLQEAKKTKINDLKEKRDINNIKPLVREGNLINPSTMEILPNIVQFYFIATRHPTNQASDAGTLLEQAQKRNLIPYFSKNVATGEKVIVALTKELSIDIENHLMMRNATNYYHFGQLETQVNNATTIEEVEAINW